MGLCYSPTSVARGTPSSVQQPSQGGLEIRTSPDGDPDLSPDYLRGLADALDAASAVSTETEGTPMKYGANRVWWRIRDLLLEAGGEDPR